MAPTTAIFKIIQYGFTDILAECYESLSPSTREAIDALIAFADEQDPTLGELTAGAYMDALPEVSA